MLDDYCCISVQFLVYDNVIVIIQDNVLIFRTCLLLKYSKDEACCLSLIFEGSPKCRRTQYGKMLTTVGTIGTG